MHASYPRILTENAQLASALHHLHTRQPAVLHRDVTSANVLITAGGHAKLSDFGFAIDASAPYRLRILHRFKPAYAAPEVWAARPYTEKSEVHAFGTTLFEICTLLDPVTSRRRGHGVMEQVRLVSGTALGARAVSSNSSKHPRSRLTPTQPPFPIPIL